MLATVGQLPAPASLHHETAAGVGVLFFFVHGEQFEFYQHRLISDAGAGQSAKGHAVIVQGHLVARHTSFSARGFSGTESWRVAVFKCRKTGGADEHAAQFRLAAHEIQQAEFRIAFAQQNFARIKAVQVQAVPDAVITLRSPAIFFLNQAWGFFAHEHIQLEMAVGAVLGDEGTGGVGRMPPMVAMTWPALTTFTRGCNTGLDIGSGGRKLNRFPVLRQGGG